jgi:hypothetical protein
MAAEIGLLGSAAIAAAAAVAVAAAISSRGSRITAAGAVRIPN